VTALPVCYAAKLFRLSAECELIKVTFENLELDWFVSVGIEVDLAAFTVS
jgi:hypothetical protein